MKNLIKTSIATGLSLVAIFAASSTVYASGTGTDAFPSSTATPSATPSVTTTVTPSVTVTPTATPTPYIISKVVCETGAYGQQNCHTEEVTVVQKVEEKPHSTVKAGIQENIIAALFVVFALLAGSFVYSKSRA
jgi:hypothetical protein